MSDERISIYETVTRSIIVELEQGAIPWIKPWKTGTAVSPRNAVSQRLYRGVNVLLLWSAALKCGYGNPTWLSYKQALELNGHVKRGEHGTRIVYAATATKTERSDNGSEVDRRVRFLKWYSVFNVEQTEGLPPHLYVSTSIKPLEDALGHVAAFITQIGADLRHGGDEAFYNPKSDFIMLPVPQRFESASAYHAVSLHEHAHWSGHPARLDRDLSGRFGTEAYAAEELVAELAAAFLCAALAIPGELRHAGYIQAWLKLLERDKKAIFTAASAASKAADYLRQLGEHGDWIREYEGAEDPDHAPRENPGTACRRPKQA